MSTDVVELILADHRRMEELFRTLRDRTADRAKALDELAATLVAHAEAEEAKVYPALRRYKQVDDDEVEHSAEEHAEGNIALLALLEVEDTESEEWEGKLEELVSAITHHLDEEERTILNDARETVADDRRAELGEQFQADRDQRVDSGCGSVEYVRALVERTKHRVD